MTIFDVEIGALTGGPAHLDRYRDHAVLVVNVASRCGHTPQYAGLQDLHERYAERGLVVLGVPCNQFGGQEPGTAGDIEEFCQVSYGVTFPLTEKSDVNGPDRHALYKELVSVTDREGYSGDVRWNFEKFLIGPDGTPVARFGHRVRPDDPDLVASIEKLLPR
jgi:glutathione peroxidase